MPVTLSVICPCFNEEANISPLVKRLDRTLTKSEIEYEIILIDDNSTDSTLSEIKTAASQNVNIRYTSNYANLGIFKSWINGIGIAKGAYVCLIDSDLQNPPEEIPRLLEELYTKPCDIVQATRSSIGRAKDSRYILSRALNKVANTVFFTNFKDFKSGFVIASIEVLKDILNYRKNYYYPQTFILLSAIHKSYVVREVETLFVERHAGSSFLTTKGQLKASCLTLIDLTKAFIDYTLRTPDSDLDAFMRMNRPSRDPDSYTFLQLLHLRIYFLSMFIHKWMITRRSYKLFKSLRRSQYLNKEQLEAYQLQKLRKLIRHCYYTVPYYRNKMQRLGVTPECISNLDDLVKLPFLTKQEVRENLYFSLFSTSHNKSLMQKISTSGSTGEPFITYVDRNQLEWRFATTLRSYEWAGWKIGDKQIRLWHQTIGMTLIQIIKERIDAILLNRRFIPAFEIGKDNIDTILTKFNKYKPVIFDGYAESFNLLARYVQKQKVNVKVKSIISSAQILTDETRRVIENAFGAKVYDKYGSREFSGIAYEAGEANVHYVMGESYIVEVIKNGRPALPGETGEIFITDLNNLSVPFIRYRIGDLAEVPLSTSDRKYPYMILGSIIGRSQATIVTPSGRWVPASGLLHLLKEYSDCIRHFQFVQDQRDSVTFKVVKGEEFDSFRMDLCLTEVSRLLGSDIEVMLEFVNSIPLVRTGKRTPIVSKLDFDFQNLN
jgi:phenylacetate-CoA ligase